MKNIHFTLGLPRSGSTLLMNILQQNPNIFTSSTCPTPYLVNTCKETSTSVSEFISMDQDVHTKCLMGFLRGGLNGWFEGLTTKPVVISKSRVWDTYLNILFKLYEKPKFIVIVRDIRDVVCSFEKLLFKYPQWSIGAPEYPLHLKSIEERIEHYCTDTSGNLGRPLHFLPHVVEWANKRPECFYFLRFEDFNKNPVEHLQHLYQWLDLPVYNHDLNNIQQSEQYEHDTVYRALVTHKTEPSLRYLEPSWPKMLTPEQSNLILVNNKWFYDTFYRDLVGE
jgi:sulfotransferase